MLMKIATAIKPAKAANIPLSRLSWPMPGPIVFSETGGSISLAFSEPAFNLLTAVSESIHNRQREYWTGVVYTTNKRVWEYDERFKKHLRKTRAMAIDMETATIFTVGFANEIPTGALLLVSDQPMISDGVKTTASDKKISNSFVEEHLRIGIEAMSEIINNKTSVKHHRF